MTEHGFRGNVAEFKRPLAAVDAILADPEFNEAIEHMLAKTASNEEITALFANVSERHATQDDDIHKRVQDIDKAIALRLHDVDPDWPHWDTEG